MIFIHVDNLFYRHACSAKFCRSCSCPVYKTRACTWAMPSPINLQGPSGLFRSSSSHGKKPSQATQKGGLRKSTPGRPCHEKQSDQEPGCTLQLDDRLKQESPSPGAAGQGQANSGRENAEGGVRMTAGDAQAARASANTL